MEYNFSKIEQKWRKHWQDTNIYAVDTDTTKPKYYVLDMFPYPSGSGLHVGHPLGYIASDIFARYKRLKGFNVLHPMGFDSFGLPAEQYALETGQHPADTTKKNTQRYREQLDNIGFCFDWDRAVQTSDPNYYKWTQWIFLQLFNSWVNPATNKAEPLNTLIEKLKLENNYDALNNKEQQNVLMKYRIAYRAESYVNWCEALGTVLANDEVNGGISERGGHPVERKLMSQWFLRITAFTERLLEGINHIDFPESLKEMQRNWIGKSIGAEIDFAIENNAQKIKVFTTRPDTIFGVDFMVLAPEHALVNSITTDAQKTEIDTYVKYVKSRSERERQIEKKISGAFTGAYCVHPFTQKPIPVWISEYVLAGYGTGAIMAVPSGDERDFAFANHFKIGITNIFEGINITENAYSEKNALLANSDFLNGLNYKEASAKCIAILEEKNIGTSKTNYKMRDAGFSRQRYWGEPFPIIYDAENNAVAIENVPVALPHVATYSSGPNGKGPLANITDWVNTENGMRETDTMPGYAGSSWYYLRYMDPKNDTAFASKKATDYWNQVDVYIGGAEHAVGHLLYSRMWCKCLHDLGFIGFDEPFKKVINQGMIGGNSRFVYRINQTNKYVSDGLKDNFDTTPIHVDVSIVDGVELDVEKFKQWRPENINAEFELENGKYICGSALEKMSKSKYNVVNPDEIIAQYGADTFRMYEMFLGPIEMSKPWDTQGIEGTFRFIKKLWRLFFDATGNINISEEKATEAELKLLHKHIKKISADIENFAFNTSVSQFMITTNELVTLKCNKREILEPLVITLASFAPFVSEELFAMLGNKTSVLDAKFPDYDESILVENNFNYPIAVNGKARSEMPFALDINQPEIEAAVLQNEIVQKWLEGRPVKKFVFVKGKMINVVG
jgi:leucyl-tRNA synthetase